MLATCIKKVQIAECDARLMSIKVPDTISRSPKSLEKYKKWKGIVPAH